MSEQPEYVPKSNRNPLLKFPRKHSCICGSGETFELCCLKYQPRSIPKDWAARISQVWERLLNGSLRIVPPKEAKRAEQPDYNSKMPDVPLVPEGNERVLARAADHAATESGVDGRNGSPLGQTRNEQPGN